MPTIGGRSYGDVIRVVAVMASGESETQAFSIPRNCTSMTVLIPLDVNSAGFWKLQHLRSTTTTDESGPATATITSDVWEDSYVWDPVQALPFQLAVPVSAGALTFSKNEFGGGVVRISTYTSTQTANRTWQIFFSGFHN